MVAPRICERDRRDFYRFQHLRKQERVWGQPVPDTDCFRFPRRLVPLAVLPSSPLFRAWSFDCAERGQSIFC